MPIDASIPLQVRPPQITNPLADVAQVLQLKQAQQLLPLKIKEAEQNQQESALRLQQMQQAVNDRKALDAAYTGAVTNDPDTGLPTFDRTKLSDALIKAGQGHQIPVLLKSLDDSAEAHTKLQKAQADLQQIHVENGAAIGAGAQATGYDPAFFRQRLTVGVANGSLDPKNVQPIIQQLDQANQQDPTGVAAKQVVQKYAQSLMDQSEKMRNALGSQARGAAATTQANTAVTREARESAAQTFTQAVGALATNPPKDAASYQQVVDALPHGVASRILQAVPVDQYDPSKAADAFNKAAMTADQRFKADNPTQTGARVPVEQQAVDTAAQVVAKKLGITLDPKKPWQSQIPIERQSSVFQLAKQITKDPAVAEIAAGNRADARSDKSYQFSVKELDAVGKPIADAVSRMGRLQDTLAQNSPQADALIGPELLTVMAGGAGSGLRMNEAEIARVIGGRSNWESLKAAINKWQLDPSKANSITADQRNQIRALVSTVATKVQQKQQIIDQANQDLLQSDNPAVHRQAIFKARKALTSVDETAGAQQGGRPSMLPDSAKAQLKEGHVTTFGNGQKWTLKNGQPQQVAQ